MSSGARCDHSSSDFALFVIWLPGYLFDMMLNHHLQIDKALAGQQTITNSPQGSLQPNVNQCHFLSVQSSKSSALIVQQESLTPTMGVLNSVSKFNTLNKP